MTQVPHENITQLVARAEGTREDRLQEQLRLGRTLWEEVIDQVNTPQLYRELPHGDNYRDIRGDMAVVSANIGPRAMGLVRFIVNPSYASLAGTADWMLHGHQAILSIETYGDDLSKIDHDPIKYTDIFITPTQHQVDPTHYRNQAYGAYGESGTELSIPDTKTVINLLGYIAAQVAPGSA